MNTLGRDHHAKLERAAKPYLPAVDPEFGRDCSVLPQAPSPHNALNTHHRIRKGVTISPPTESAAGTEQLMSRMKETAERTCSPAREIVDP